MRALASGRALSRAGRVLALVAFFVGVFGLLFPTLALAKYQPPPLRSAVVDEAGVLDDAEEARIAQRLDTLRREKGFAIVVFLPSALGDEAIEDVAYETFNTWQVGATKKDDGVLLIIAPADRKMRIETGKGVGDRLTDVQSARIIREVLAPRLRNQDYVGAVDEGTRAIERALTGEDPVVGSPTRDGRSRVARKSVPLTSTQKWVIGGVVVVIIFLAIVSSGFRRVLFSILQVLIWAALMGRGGGRGGGSSGGGGGYSGGGGRSGGGGASGGW